MIHVRSVHKHFGEFAALRGVDFHVPRGALCGFIGPNGAGKTTTMRILATLELPSAGQVEIAGFDVAREVRQVRQVMGYMPDYAGVYPSFTGHEYLEFFARALGLPPARRSQRLREVIEFTEIGALLSRPVEGLSKGQRQRLSLARAILPDPALLILDEPAEGLDPRARIDLRELLKVLSAQGKTVFISSHILSELTDLVTWVVIIDRGTVRYVGPPDANAQQHTHAYDLELASDPAQAQRFLLEQPGVLSAEPTDAGVLFVLDESRTAIDALVIGLVGAGVRLRQLQRRQTDLEAVFMRVVHRGSDAPAG
jgi:ABC-2 type transport system ATP-binding protein